MIVARIDVATVDNAIPHPMSSISDEVRFGKIRRNRIAPAQILIAETATSLIDSSNGAPNALTRSVMTSDSVPNGYSGPVFKLFQRW